VTRDYLKAEKRVRQAETNLRKLLDRLKVAREEEQADKAAKLLDNALDALEVMDDALDTAEKLRQKYWIERAKKAEEKLLEIGCPLLSEALFCREATANRAVMIPPTHILRSLMQLPRTPIAADEQKIPSSPLQFQVLERADEELLLGHRWRHRSPV
jgi:hypothetical protein